MYIIRINNCLSLTLLVNLSLFLFLFLFSILFLLNTLFVLKAGLYIEKGSKGEFKRDGYDMKRPVLLIITTATVTTSQIDKSV